MSPTTKPGYTLIYWGKIPGRGEFVRLALTYAGQKFNQSNAPATVSGYMLNLKKANPPIFAPPILQLPGGQHLTQTGNILNYLGRKYGLDGCTPEEHGDDVEIRRAHVNQLVLTALDWNLEAHDTHHPVGMGLYYEDQIPEAKRRSEEFRAQRIPKFLNFFSLVLKGNAEGGEEGYLVGKETTTADLALMHVLCGLDFAFPRRMAVMKKEAKYDLVFKVKERLETDEKLVGYLGSKDRLPFSMGIFRHYPELDGEE